MSTSRAIDLRERGRWGLGQRAKNDAIYALVRLALAGSGLLSLATLRALGGTLGRFAHRAFAGARTTARENVGRAMPAASLAARDALVARAFARLGEQLGDAVFHLRPDAGQVPLPFADADRAVLDDARAEGRGVLFASAHLGPWERVAASLVAHGVPLVAVAREAYDPRLDAIYEKLRASRGVRAIYRGAPGAATAMLRVLRSGGVLGIPMDLRSRVPSVDVPFFGHTAPTPVGPARLALRTGAAVVVGTCAPGRGAHEPYALTFERVHTSDLDLGRGPEGERTLSGLLNAALCRRILALPEEWVWMHERFGSSADSTPSGKGPPCEGDL